MTPAIASSALIFCVFFFGTLQSNLAALPPRRELEIPFLEQQTIGSEVYDLKADLLSDRRPGVFFKLLDQYMTLGADTIDEVTSWVALDEDTGVVTVKKPVDRESDCGENSLPCVIHVKVVRKPQPDFQLFDLKLDVVDINDHAPVFPAYAEYGVNVSESSPVGKRINIDRYLATDADIGNNAKISYTYSRNDHFSIYSYDDETGAPHLELVVSDDLDHETRRSYDLVLTATDKGMPQPRSSSVTLRIRVTDANDNPPIFDRKLYQLTLRENLESGSEIITVHAQDDDSGVFGEIEYYIPTRGNVALAQRLIAVDPSSGEVRLREPLDREKHNNLRIVIGARDKTGEQTRRVGKTILEIQVTDENDNSPAIKVDIFVHSDNDIAFISESSKVGTYVAEVSADDADYAINGEVTIDISTHLTNDFNEAESSEENLPWNSEPEDISGYFVLEDGGIITVGRHLNRERYPEFRISITACDHALVPLCSAKNLTIKLLDENDNFPVFNHGPKRVTLREDVDLGTLVTTVTASDRDFLYQPAMSLTKDNRLQPSSNGLVRYELSGGAGCFNIDQMNGKVRLIGTLDYEKKKIWKLTVTAKDLGHPSKSSNITLDVVVTDVNDNAPAFSNPAVTNQTVAATIQSGDVITKINAVDYDEGLHSDLWYSITSEDNDNSPSKFILDQFNGNLRLNMSNPHLKEMLGTHVLTIKAQDLGSPPLQGFTILRVEVYDVPLSVLPSFTKLSNEPAEASGDLTVVLIASLASATVLLVLVLTGVVVKCKRENKEIRTYNCRNAETSKGWELSASHGTLPSDVIVTSSNHLMASRDSHLNSITWTQDAETKLTYDSKQIVESYRQSMPNSQRTLERKMTSFTKESRNISQPPSLPQVDGDSGRGDSDHDSGTYEEKDNIPQAKISQQVYNHYQDSSDIAFTNIPESDNLGPLCSHLCRQYGHSDACWMPTDQQPQSDYYLPADPQRPITPYCYHAPSQLSHAPMGGLETICETQPLHSVLGGEEYEQFVEYDEDQASASFINRSDNESYPVAHTIPHSSTSSYWSHPQSPAMPTSHVTSLNRRHSASDLFHDGIMSNATPVTTSYYHPDVATPSAAPRAFSSSSSSRCESPRNYSSGNRRSTASLHSELLHRRFLAAANGSSRADETHVTQSNQSQYGEVSMLETQQIINDIDQLIDN